MGARGNDPDRSAATLPEQHGDGPASLWESPWIDVGIWAFAIGTTALTLWYSLGPTPPGHGSDKQLHAAAYFVNTLAVLLAIVWRPGRGAGRFDRWALPVVVGMLVLGGLIEIVQGGFVGRDSQFTDWFADAVGITLAVMAFATLRRAVRAIAAARQDRPRHELTKRFRQRVPGSGTPWCTTTRFAMSLPNGVSQQTRRTKRASRFQTCSESRDSADDAVCDLGIKEPSDHLCVRGLLGEELSLLDLRESRSRRLP